MYQFCDGESEKPFPKHFEKKQHLIINSHCLTVQQDHRTNPSYLTIAFLLTH